MRPVRWCGADGTMVQLPALLDATLEETRHTMVFPWGVLLNCLCGKKQKLLMGN